MLGAPITRSRHAFQAADADIHDSSPDGLTESRAPLGKYRQARVPRLRYVCGIMPDLKQLYQAVVDGDAEVSKSITEEALATATWIGPGCARN
jgi:hypothetical protein